MLRSMTGYGRGESVAERLPRAIAAYEADARKIVMEKMTRGKLSLVVSWGNDAAEAEEPSGTLTLDRKTADRYLNLLDEAKGAYKLKGDLDLNTFASLPNIFVWQETAHE